MNMSQTIMLGEWVNDTVSTNNTTVNWASNWGTTASPQLTAFQHVKFPVAQYASNPLQQYTTPAAATVDPLVPANTPLKYYFSSNHRGIVIVVFFDGHGETLSETIDCSVPTLYMPRMQ